jgi:hypothetical protein
MAATVTSFTGLQNLTNIQEFKADFNSLTSIDLSGMSTLTEVDLSDNDLPDSSTSSLTSVNLSGCSSITELYIDDSDFSAGLPDLSDCTSLKYMDVDQSNLVGSIDLSNFPALEGFDFSGNLGLTEVIISSTQPLGNGETSINLNDCAFTQTVVDNILVTLASGSISEAYINISNDSGGTNAAPSQIGRDALFTLYSRGCEVDVASGDHTLVTVSTDALEANICSVSNTDYIWFISGSWVEVGNIAYRNSDAYLPAPDGWYRVDGDGSVKFEVSGSGEIISVNPCGV